MSEIQGDTVFTHDFVRKQMQKGICEIVFEKLDGTMREMTCTLMESEIPEDALNFSNKGKERSKETLAVYDTEANGWRSFRINKLKELKVNYV